MHLQLVHYRVSELGDISTERPQHGGLTPFGKDVLRACNRLGMLVDVAHCTSEGIEQALSLSSKPMVYSHGHVTSASPHYTQSNARFAVSVDPGNADLQKRKEAVDAARAKGEPTIPSVLGDEFKTNPFLRPFDPAIREALGVPAGATDEEAFAAIRAAKDCFR